jgi:hypothetical protein
LEKGNEKFCRAFLKPSFRWRVALIQETYRIIALELSNGKVDGLDAEGHAIDWKKEMKNSVERSLNRVLDGVMKITSN